MKLQAAEQREIDRLLELTGESLGFQLHEADSLEEFDVFEARSLEILELVYGEAEPDWIAKRAELEARHGRGFLARVAAMGEPARATLRRAGLLVALVFCLMWPNAAAAAPASHEFAEDTHRSTFRRRRGKLPRSLRFDDTTPDLWVVAECGWWRRRSVSFERRSGLIRGLRTGRARGRTSSRARAGRSKSCSSGDGGGFASASFQTSNHFSRWSSLTERLSVRRGPRPSEFCRLVATRADGPHASPSG